MATRRITAIYRGKRAAHRGTTLYHAHRHDYGKDQTESRGGGGIRTRRGRRTKTAAGKALGAAGSITRCARVTFRVRGTALKFHLSGR
jgi:hypothetical protein